ncbi:hypothetical protein ACFX2B_001170 [Malus domestica]
MGTREVYEQKLRSGNLQQDPTMNPGFGTPRCLRCLSLFSTTIPKNENGPSPLFFTMPSPRLLLLEEMRFQRSPLMSLFSMLEE